MQSTIEAAEYAMQDSVLYFYGFPSIHSNLAGKLGGVRYATIIYHERKPLSCCSESAKQAFWIVAPSPGSLSVPVPFGKDCFCIQDILWTLITPVYSIPH